MIPKKILHKLIDKLQALMGAVEDDRTEDAARDWSAFFVLCRDYLSVKQIIQLIQEIAAALRHIAHRALDDPTNTGGG